MSAPLTHFSGHPDDNLKLPPKRREKPYRETADVTEAVERLIMAVAKRIADEDPDDLLLIRRLEVAVEHAWAIAVAGQRQSAHTDGAIGRALGTTKQNVQKRWPRSEEV